MQKKRKSSTIASSPSDVENASPASVKADEDEDGNADLSLEILAKAKRSKLGKDTKSHSTSLTFQGETDLISNQKDESRPSAVEDADGSIPFFERFVAAETNEVNDFGILNGAGPSISVDARESKTARKKRKTKQPNSGNKQSQDIPLTGNGTVDSRTNEGTDSTKMRKRGFRYFDEPKEIQCCYNCGEKGHLAINCTEKKPKKRCYICGNDDHAGRECLKGMECFVCNMTGHVAKDCPKRQSKNSSSRGKSSFCLLCGDHGHIMASCTTGYKEEDLKKVQCYICKEFGHLCCLDIVNSSATEVSCYSCGGSGHTGEFCKGNNAEGGYLAQGRRESGMWTSGVHYISYEYSPENNEFSGLKSAPYACDKFSRKLDSLAKQMKSDTTGSFRVKKHQKKKNKKKEDSGSSASRNWRNPKRHLRFGYVEKHNSRGQLSTPFSQCASAQEHYNSGSKNFSEKKNRKKSH